MYMIGGSLCEVHSVAVWRGRPGIALWPPSFESLSPRLYLTCVDLYTTKTQYNSITWSLELHRAYLQRNRARFAERRFLTTARTAIWVRSLFPHLSTSVPGNSNILRKRSEIEGRQENVIKVNFDCFCRRFDSGSECLDLFYISRCLLTLSLYSYSAYS